MKKKLIAVRVDGTKYINLRKLYLEKGTNVASEIRKFIDSELAKIPPVIELDTASNKQSQIQFPLKRPSMQK